MKKEILIPLLLILLGLLFAIINVMVFFFKGNKWFVKKKLKVGAMILSLTSLLGCGSPFGTCYAPTKEQLDSARQDSINKAENLKRINDSIAQYDLEKKRIEDSIVLSKRIKTYKDKPNETIPIRTCYKPTNKPPKPPNKKNGTK